MIFSPLLFFGVLEAGLRLGDYGYPTGFFVGPDANGVCRTNLQFGWRFFPRSLARTPAACLLSAKPAGAIRIFVLGSSAAQGVPDPTFSVGRILESLLRDRYPDVKFEVVNGAMTAINSHVAVEIARDCAAHQPDLFVVYMGNNEVVGPYGPGTVFQQWSPSLRFIRANVWLKSTRTGQLLDDAIGWLHPRKGAHTAWQGLEMFMDNPVAADDPRLPAVYDDFRRNLVDICQIARRAGAGVVLSTVAVNLKDCPPFASQHRSDLSADDLTKWKALYLAGVELEGKEKWQQAIAKYEAAAKIDDRFAELAFRRGRCLAALRRWKEAREQFISARDLDVLRFRADSQINEAVRDVAAEQETAGVRLVDAEQSLAKSDLAVGGIPGDGLFYEHVHFTFDGNYLLARAVLNEIESALPQLTASRKQAAGPLKRAMRGIAGVESLGRTSDGEFNGRGIGPAAVHESVGSFHSYLIGAEAGGRTRPAGKHAGGHRGGVPKLRGGLRQDTGRLALPSASREVGAGKRPPEDGPGTPAGSCEAASGGSRSEYEPRPCRKELRTARRSYRLFSESARNRPLAGDGQLRPR